MKNKTKSKNFSKAFDIIVNKANQNDNSFLCNVVVNVTDNVDIDVKTSTSPSTSNVKNVEPTQPFE